MKRHERWSKVFPLITRKAQNNIYIIDIYMYDDMFDVMTLIIIKYLRLYVHTYNMNIYQQ